MTEPQASPPRVSSAGWLSDPKTGSPQGDGSALCPACRRFIGTALVCPYCEAEVPDAGWKRALRYGALAMAVTGVGFLYWMARAGELVVTPIEALDSTLKYAVVRIAGEVVRPPYVARSRGPSAYLSFVVSDGSGEVRVSAYGRTAEKVLDEQRLPSRGDRVEVTGAVWVSRDGVLGVTLRDARHLRRASEEERATKMPTKTVSGPAS